MEEVMSIDEFVDFLLSHSFNRKYDSENILRKDDVPYYIDHRNEFIYLPVNIDVETNSGSYAIEGNREQLTKMLSEVPLGTEIIFEEYDGQDEVRFKLTLEGWYRSYEKRDRFYFYLKPKIEKK